MKSVEEILSPEELSDLRKDLDQVLNIKGSYEMVEDLLLEYGLEMDYLEQLIY